MRRRDRQRERISMHILILIFLTSLGSCFGQMETPLARVRTLKLPTVEGRVPVIYSMGAKARALRYQATLGTAHNWYEAQLGISLPLTLPVLDKRHREL